MKKRNRQERWSEKVKRILEEYGPDRYLIFAGGREKTEVFYKPDNENALVELIVLGVIEGLKDEPERQEFLRTVLLSAVTGDAYGAGWWDRLKKVVNELDGKGPKWFGRA